MPTDKPPYQEDNDDFIPDPTAQFGTVDTSGTGGAAHSRIEEATSIFQIAREAELEQAARALDPKDTTVPESNVILPPGRQLLEGDPEEARNRIKEAAAEAKKNPTAMDPTKTPAQLAAAEDTSKDDKTSKRETAAEKKEAAAEKKEEAAAEKKEAAADKETAKSGTTSTTTGTTTPRR